jgi:nicotinate-nucleotide pyrophosphorylase
MVSIATNVSTCKSRVRGKNFVHHEIPTRKPLPALRVFST